VSAAYRVGRGRVELEAQHAGRQYLDNNQDAAATIEPWTVANAALAWKAPIGEFTLRVSNLLDTRYETAGYVDYPAPLYAPTPVWIPAATRSFFFGVKASL